jgi:8-oxo-dGTP diphosphatase
MNYTTEYIPPTLTVDAVIFQLINNQLSVLLMNRPHQPFAGSWALPGGYSPEGETTMQALERIVTEKTGVSLARDLRFIEQLYTFDTVARDPRGHAVSVTYMGCGRDVVPRDISGSVAFFPVDTLPELAYDHAAIIRYAHERLIAKLAYTNAVYAFLPTAFTLADLQTAYEAIFGHELDKRNFRKKFQSQNLIHETGDMQRSGAHRPAKLYTFNTQQLESLPKNFD